MLSRAECLKILELAPGADSYEIENRYTMLIKRYRGQDDPAAAAQLEQITLAYNILTGRYVEPEPVNPRLEKIILGKSLRQWKNIWHYGRFPLLAGVLILAMVVYFIYSIATNEPSDFQIGFIGRFSQTEEAEDNISAYVQSIYPAFDEVEYTLLPMDFSSFEETDTTSAMPSGNSSNLYEYSMKFLTILVGESYEVYVCDQQILERYAPQGAFTELSDYYADLAELLPTDLYARIKPVYGLIEPAETDADGLPVTPVTGATALFGLDVSDLNLSEGLGIYGDSEVLTVGSNASAKQEAYDFLTRWILDYQTMNTRQSEYEAAATAG